MTEFENNNFAAYLVIDSDSQWMLKLLAEILLGDRFFT